MEMTSVWQVYVLLIDPTDDKKIITIHKSNKYVIPGGKLYPDETYLSGAQRLVKQQLGVSVKTKHLNILDAGHVKGYNIITYLASKWSGKLNSDYNGSPIMIVHPEEIRSKFYFKERIERSLDDYFDRVYDMYIDYRKSIIREKINKKSKCLLL